MGCLRLTIISVCLCASIASAQPRRRAFEHILPEHGLPDASVLALLQDHLGYLWIGTQGGLVKYDGYVMRTYYAVREDSQSLASSGVFCLDEDKDGTLWIGTGGGLHRFDRESNTFA